MIILGICRRLIGLHLWDISFVLVGLSVALIVNWLVGVLVVVIGVVLGGGVGVAVGLKRLNTKSLWFYLF